MSMGYIASACGIMSAPDHSSADDWAQPRPTAFTHTFLSSIPPDAAPYAVYIAIDCPRRLSRMWLKVAALDVAPPAVTTSRSTSLAHFPALLLTISVSSLRLGFVGIPPSSSLAMSRKKDVSCTKCWQHLVYSLCNASKTDRRPLTSAKVAPALRAHCRALWTSASACRAPLLSPWALQGWHRRSHT